MVGVLGLLVVAEAQEGDQDPRDQRGRPLSDDLRVNGLTFPGGTPMQGSVLGLFFDASVRAGYAPTRFFEAFLNLRYLGGGARGPGSKPLSSDFGDGHVDNFIHAMTASVGITLK